MTPITPMTIVAVLLYFALMLAIGVYALRRSTQDQAAYLLGGRKLGPAVTALSAGASDMSAWILMGLPGAMVANGFSSAWIAAGLAIGAYWNYRLVAPRLRIYTELTDDSLTLPDFFSARFEDRRHLLRLCAAAVIIVFFTLYTASGLVAGGVLFESSFGLNYELGLWLTLLVVVAYTLLGGFHAVCMTDFVQGCLMFVALVLVPLVAFTQLGSWDAVTARVAELNPAHLYWVAGIGLGGLLSNLAWGLGYFGQPHIVVRFMAIRSVRELPVARRIGMSWMTVSLCGSLLTGFVGLAWMREQGLALDDPETIFIVLTQLLFHPLIAGFLLAAILAAIMSTISSQLLVSSSSLAEDIYRVLLRPGLGEREAVRVSRVSVVLVALVAALIARGRSSTILDLVSNAWAGFGAAFGPLVLLSLYWKGLTWQGALAGMLSGALVVLLWIYLPVTVGGRSPGEWIYEIVPGFACSLLASWLVSRMTPPAPASVRQRFERMRGKL